MKILMESEEVKRILSLHRQENNKIQEQSSSLSTASVKKTRQELTIFFTKAKTIGCLTDKNLDYSNFFSTKGGDKAYIKGPSISMPGMVKRVYDDFSWEIVDPKTGQSLKKSVWKCDEISNDTSQSDSDAVLKEKKEKEGWMEYSELVGKGFSQLQADQGVYDTIQFKLKNGKTITLYKPKVGIKSGQQKSMTDEQQAFITKWNAKGGKLTLTPEEQASQKFRKVKIPGSESAGWANGLEMWFSVEGIKNMSDTGKELKTTISGQTIPLDECKEFVDQFFAAYQSDSDIPDFDIQKRKVQRCKSLYSPNERTGKKNGWGMLNSQRNKIDILSGLVSGQGPSTAGVDSKWRLSK
jgi:hypothetical protein